MASAITLVCIGSLRSDLLRRQYDPRFPESVFLRVRRTNEWSYPAVSIIDALLVRVIRFVGISM